MRIRIPRAAKLTIGIVGAVVVLALIAGGTFALVLSHTYDSKRHVVDAFPAATGRPAPAAGKAAEAVDVLLIGTDVDDADPESPQLVGKREADTVMLVHIPADRSKVYAISLLRNSLVDVAGHGQQPVNAAYAYGGVKLTVQAVEQLLDVRIDHVVDVSLSGLKDLTDALGGVTITNPTEFTSDGHEFAMGRQRLDGAAALAYLRNGDFRAAGDATRVASQERYFRGVFNQVLDARILLDPLGIQTAVSVFSPYMTTDRGLDSGALVSLGLSLRGVRGDDVRMLHVRSSGIGMADGASVVLLDRARLAALRVALRSDALAGFRD